MPVLELVQSALRKQTANLENQAFEWLDSPSSRTSRAASLPFEDGVSSPRRRSGAPQLRPCLLLGPLLDHHRRGSLGSPRSIRKYADSLSGAFDRRNRPIGCSHTHPRLHILHLPTSQVPTRLYEEVSPELLPEICGPSWHVANLVHYATNEPRFLASAGTVAKSPK